MSSFNEAFNICFTANENYIKYVAVLINSIISNFDKKTEFDVLNGYKKIESFKLYKPIYFHIITDGIEKNSEEKLRSFLKTFEYPCGLYIHNFSDEYFIERGISPWSRDKKYLCNYRLFLSDIFKDEKILYLDVDMLVLGDLRLLWGLDLEDKTGAVVDDQCFARVDVCKEILSYKNDKDIPAGLPKGIKRHRLRKSKITKEKVFLFKDENYFNSGFLFLDMQKFKDRKCKEKCFEFLESYETWLPDQDALNIAMPAHEVMWLPMEYNIMRANLLDFSLKSKNIEKIYKVRDYQNRKVHPQVVHFICADKPWKKVKKNIKAYTSWVEYARQTPWWDEIQKGIEEEKLKRKNEKIAKNAAKTLTASLDSFM